MATIDRRNILNLIGKHRGKYHSCILTCYNFDFSFFEERVLPVLRTANIKNINILADGNYLEQAQEMTTGREFRFNKTYNFLPVYEQGVFHPKIMLLTGLKHGLLIIGSGNITSSGLNTNDEIWGAFHLDHKENDNAQLFSRAWKYLQGFASVEYGFLPQKIEWIKKYSPWLLELPDEAGPIELFSINQSIQLFTNSSTNSIYQQLTAAVPSDRLKTLTVISPYYDKQGLFLAQLIKDYNPQFFNCIVDTNSGKLPLEISDNVRSKINFFDWQKCMRDYIFDVSRLHAKLLHFEYTDGNEKMLLGSANATMAAMGSKTIPSANAEACILISRSNSKNWLRDLKIKIPKKSITISEYSDVSGLDSSTQQRSYFPIRILYSELKGNELNCYLNTTILEHLYLVIISRNDDLLESIPLSIFEKKGTVKINNVESVFKVYIVNSNKERKSNYSIVHRLEMLLRCNPDPAQERFDALLEQDFPEGDGVTVLLEFLDYTWADDELENAIDSKKIHTAKLPINIKPTLDKVYRTLPSEEFNKVSDAVLLKQSGLLSSTNIKLADFLNLVLSGNDIRESDYSESEEQKLLDDQEGKGEGSDVQPKASHKADALKERQALCKYFIKLDDIYNKKLENFYSVGALTVTPNDPVTIKSISKILIALQLIQVYHTKRFTIQVDEEDYANLREERYLWEGSTYDESDTIKGFLMNAFGKFLLLATAGFNEYDYSILNEKMSFYRRQVFEKALIIVLGLNWRSDEDKKYQLSLLLNLHYYVLPNNGNDWFDVAKERTKSIANSGAAPIGVLEENLQNYMMNFLPGYNNWLIKYKGSQKSTLVKDASLLNVGNIIFSNKLGFNYVSRIVRRHPFVLDLKREGYQFTDNGYVVENITYGNKFIQY